MVESDNNLFYLYGPYLYGNIHKKHIDQWTAKTDIFTYPYLIIPIHIHEHWIVFITHIVSEEIIEYTIYDSMSQTTTPVKSMGKVIGKITKYLEGEWNKLRSGHTFPVFRQCNVCLYPSLFANKQN